LTEIDRLVDPPPIIELKLNFNFTPSSFLFHPSNHLLLALFNISSSYYNQSTLNRYYLVRTLAIALNISETLLNIHKINGSMIKVYFSCDWYLSNNITSQLKNLIDHYYNNRLELLPLFGLPLIEISIVRVNKPSTTTTTTTTTTIVTTMMTTTTTSMTAINAAAAAALDIKRAEITLRPRLLNGNSIQYNRTVSPLNNLILLKQFYQPLVLVPLSIIAVGLLLCAVIACCLCCNRRSSSAASLLIPNGSSTSPTSNKYFYRHYPYRKHRQQCDVSRKKSRHHDQRQFISKGKYMSR
jgi:hypothetical protein